MYLKFLQKKIHGHTTKIAVCFLIFDSYPRSQGNLLVIGGRSPLKTGFGIDKWKRIKFIAILDRFLSYSEVKLILGSQRLASG